MVVLYGLLNASSFVDSILDIVGYNLAILEIVGYSPSIDTTWLSKSLSLLPYVGPCAWSEHLCQYVGVVYIYIYIYIVIFVFLLYDIITCQDWTLTCDLGCMYHLKSKVQRIKGSRYQNHE